MNRTTSSLWLALTLGVFAVGCSKDTPTVSTDPTVALDRSREDKGRKHKDDDEDAVTYAVIGDVPYTDTSLNDRPSFPTLIAAINQDRDVRRVIHIGDIKAGSALCTDSTFQDIATQFATFTDPLVYTPGDNEWTDCHRANNGGFNPLGRLAKVRELFFQADMWHPDDRAAGAQFTAHQDFVARLSQLAAAFAPRPVLLVSGDSHNFRVDPGVPWFTAFYHVPAPANVTQVIIDRSIEINRTGAPDATPIDYLKLTINPKASSFFTWTQVNVP